MPHEMSQIFYPFLSPEGSRCRPIPILFGLQECNLRDMTVQQVMTCARTPLGVTPGVLVL